VIAVEGLREKGGRYIDAAGLELLARRLTVPPARIELMTSNPLIGVTFSVPEERDVFRAMSFAAAALRVPCSHPRLDLSEARARRNIGAALSSVRSIVVAKAARESQRVRTTTRSGLASLSSMIESGLAPRRSSSATTRFPAAATRRARVT
jgi:hypothetical protein